MARRSAHVPAAATGGCGRSAGANTSKRPPERQFRRNDRPHAASSCPRTRDQRREHHGADACRRRPKPAVHRGQRSSHPCTCLTPATPRPPLQGRCAVVTLARSGRRRGSSAADLAGRGRRRTRDTQHGRRRRTGRRRAALTLHVHHRWRLRRSEYQGGPIGDSSRSAGRRLRREPAQFTFGAV